MNPISLFESGESNGTVSVKDLFNDIAGFDGCHSDPGVDGIIYAICRGGWSHALMQTDREKSLLVAKDLLQQICEIKLGQNDVDDGAIHCGDGKTDRRVQQQRNTDAPETTHSEDRHNGNGMWIPQG